MRFLELCNTPLIQNMKLPLYLPTSRPTEAAARSIGRVPSHLRRRLLPSPVKWDCLSRSMEIMYWETLWKIQKAIPMDYWQPLLSVRLIAECPWTQWSIIFYKLLYNLYLFTNSEWLPLQSMRLLWFYPKAAAWTLVEEKAAHVPPPAPAPEGSLLHLPSSSPDLCLEISGESSPSHWRASLAEVTSTDSKASPSHGPQACWPEQVLASYGPQAKSTPVPGFIVCELSMVFTSLNSRKWFLNSISWHGKII